MRPLFLFYIPGTQKYGGCWNLIIHGELLNLEHKLEDAKISNQNWDLKWVLFVFKETVHIWGVSHLAGWLSAPWGSY